MEVTAAERADVRQRQNQAQSVVCVYTSFPRRGSAGFGKHFPASWMASFAVVQDREQLNEVELLRLRVTDLVVLSSVIFSTLQAALKFRIFPVSDSVNLDLPVNSHVRLLSGFVLRL